MLSVQVMTIVNKWSRSLSHIYNHKSNKDLIWAGPHSPLSDTKYYSAPYSLRLR